MVLKDVILNTKLWIFLAGAIFLLILSLSVAGHLLASRLHMEPSRSTIIFIKSVFVLLGVGLAYCLVPIMVGLMGHFWELGLQEIDLEAIVRTEARSLPARIVKFQAAGLIFFLRHQADFVIGIWVIWLLGILIASPYIVRDLILGK